MEQVNTLDTGFDARKTADDHATDVAGLGLAIREVWARLLEHAVEAAQADELEVAHNGPDVLASYCDGAHDSFWHIPPWKRLRSSRPRL